MGKFNRDMLRVARAARGLTQSDTAKAAGVTQALVSKIENGLTVEPSQDVVAALSTALKFPRAFFYQEDKIYGLPQFHYRKRARLGARRLQRIEADINIQRKHIENLGRSFEPNEEQRLPVVDLDEMQWTPQQAARQFRGLWLVPSGPIRDITAIIEAAGVVVVPLDFGTHLLDALSFRVPGLSPLIFVNRSVPGDRFRFTLAHELAHLTIHNGPMNDDEMEDQADKFAAEFLMPANEIRPYLKNPSLGKLARVKAHWRVSIKALIYNAYQLRLITASQYRGLYINYSKAGYAKGEPFPIEVEKPQRLSEMIDYHMRELGYSLVDMANLLFLEPGEFQRRYFDKPQLRVVG